MISEPYTNMDYLNTNFINDTKLLEKMLLLNNNSSPFEI
jgi:hypothetical protein